MKKNLRLWLAANAAILAITTAHGELVVDEGFDAAVGTPIWEQGTGIGWDGNWTGTGTDSRGTPEVAAGLGLGSLVVSGGSYLRPQRYGVAESSRTISSASQTALTADNSTIWFSVLMKANVGGAGGGFSLNSNGAIVIGDTALLSTVNPGTVPPAIGAGGNAVGVSFAGNSAIANVAIQGVTYNGGTQTVGSADKITVGDTTVMIVGQIDWAENGTDDVLTLYRITDPSAALPAAFSTMLVDLDQSAFNLVATAQGQTEIFDEIRFGESFEDVVPLDTITPAPNPMTFAVAPAAISATEVTMTATTATSDNPVQYLFANTTLATDSDWQTSPTWTDSSLDTDTLYSYTVTARETTTMIETDPSGEASAFTFPEVIGDEILATVFAGRTVSGTTATITDFTLNGVSDPEDLVADPVPGSTVSVLELFDTPDAQNYFAPKTSTSAAHWQVDVPLEVDAASLSLGNIELYVQSFSGSGNRKTVHQDTYQDHYITVELFDSTQSSLGSQQIFGPEGSRHDYTSTFTFGKGIALTANESYTLRILVSGPDPTLPANAGNYVGLDAIRVLTEAASKTPFEDWQVANFPGEDDLAITGPDADPDMDGVDNLVEYGFNTDPNDSSDLPVTPVAADGTDIWIHYTQVASATDINYIVEWSNNLTDWSDEFITEVNDPAPPVDSDYPVIKASIGTAGDPALFMRVRIEQP